MPHRLARPARLIVESLETREIPAAGPFILAANALPLLAQRSAAASARPPAPHYSHIRVAELAYTGSPMGPAELALLKSSVDLVVANPQYLSAIAVAAPSIPQLVYSNISNLYLDLLTDWLTFADRHGVPRESAFYHMAAPTPFVGDSPSSQPVTRFWNVAIGPSTGSAGVSSRTVEARAGRPGGVPFGPAGQATYMGYPDRFREVNVVIAQPAGGNWAGVLEYPSVEDAAGRPTAWKQVPQVGDSTNGLRNSGTLTFDPPADWRPAVIPGSATPLYYVRVRATSGGFNTAPVAVSLLGHDYVGARGGPSGTIPAFDTLADWNHDGYLSDAEYANRRPGFDARFLYESRLFYPYYGQMRFLTNPAGAGVAGWAAQFTSTLLSTNPRAAGVFVDNSSGKFPAAGAVLVETTGVYGSAYAAVMAAVTRAVGPKLVLANTSGGGTPANAVAASVPATIEESALRPLAQSWSQFEDLSITVKLRLGAAGPSGQLILDSLSSGGSPTDPRSRMSALAEYYLLADPVRTMFMPWGGEEPASSWSRHWWDALAFNVGKPTAGWSVFATGSDPANPVLACRIYQRSYQNALVLYKPLSHTLAKGTGTIADNTASVHQLNGNYRVLNADGSLGPVTQSVTLRNGEGAILVRV